MSGYVTPECTSVDPLDDGGASPIITHIHVELIGVYEVQPDEWSSGPTDLSGPQGLEVQQQRLYGEN